MTTGFLTDDDLFTLTKRRRGSARIRVLRKQGIAFKLDGNGDPVVVWASLLAQSGQTRKRSTLNHDALQKLIDHGRTQKERTRTPQTRDVVSRRVLLSSDRRGA